MWRGLLLGMCLCVAACSWGAGSRGIEVLGDREVLDFATRIESFYRSLELVPLDIFMTYEDAELRAHFRDHRDFSDYYASLANQVRGAHFRNGVAERINIDEFQFESPERARVDLTLIGRHQRGLRFWQIDMVRSDTWELVEGAWLLNPRTR